MLAMPMREPTFFILAALQDEPLYGYVIISRAEDLSHGRVKLSTGTLYAALDRLTGERLVRVADEQVVNGRARRYYELTADGWDALHAEAARMAEAARVVAGHAAKSRDAAKPGHAAKSRDAAKPDRAAKNRPARRKALPA